MIKRYYTTEMIEKKLLPARVLVIYGPRRAGKTTLVESYLAQTNHKNVLSTTGDDIDFRKIIQSESITKIKSALSNLDLLVIDEAQRIRNIGLGLKICVDHIPNLRIIATGSSSFDLANKIGEPLTGRQKIITLFPISVLEYKDQFNQFSTQQQLENFLIYGTYPEVIETINVDEKKDYLKTLVDSYLYKDILELEQIKNADKIFDLLILIAHQVGNEVSLNELGNNLELSKQTVERYLDLLEKSFVIVKVRGFSRNLRSEVTKTARYYFLDNGVLNTIINNFNSLDRRNDVGKLWENFMFAERMKKRSYKNILANIYFWRTYDQKEIDLIEEREGNLFGYEFKYSNKIVKPPKLWINTYKDAKFETVNSDNFWEFVL
ncbi:MAG: ATP-binding protein [Acidimicrobiia bacterium]|nr:ATP-binding protein [Acidimicrobiia bacterium]